MADIGPEVPREYAGAMLRLAQAKALTRVDQSLAKRSKRQVMNPYA